MINWVEFSYKLTLNNCKTIVHLLRSHPEIQIDKKNNPYPWRHIQQHQNVKVNYYTNGHGLAASEY